MAYTVVCLRMGKKYLVTAHFCNRYSEHDLLLCEHPLEFYTWWGQKICCLVGVDTGGVSMVALHKRILESPTSMVYSKFIQTENEKISRWVMMSIIKLSKANNKK